MLSEYTLTEEEYVRANRLFSKPTRNVYVAYFLAAMCLLVSAYFVGESALRWALVAGIAGGAVGHLAVRFIYAPWKTKKLYRSYPGIKDPVSVEALKDGVKFSSNSGESVLEWSKVHKWRSNDEFVLIFHAPHVYNVVPTRLGAVTSSIKELLGDNCGAAT